ncbi:hypothetical protein ACF07D_04575 [Leucobacter sp. NPDC015123]|uniref:hypothetical protein n=1 Tax=Leucobacter sp. NPDC015123 TaxID=3364129 RepID=UPI0036F45FCC
MAKHLLLGSASENWRLHVREDADTVEERLQAGFVANELVPLRVVLADALEGDIIQVNPRALGWWCVVDLPDADARA